MNVPLEVYQVEDDDINLRDSKLYEKICTTSPSVAICMEELLVLETSMKSQETPIKHFLMNMKTELNIVEESINLTNCEELHLLIKGSI